MRVLLCALLVLCTLISSSYSASLGYCRRTSSTFTTANSFESSSYDTSTQSLFLGTKSNTPRIVYKLNTPSFPSSTSYTLSSTSTNQAVIVSINDPAAGIVYFAGGDSASNGIITKVQASSWTELNSLTLSDTITSGDIDSINGYVYFGTQTGKIVKLAVSNFSQVDELDLSSVGAVILHTAIIDAAGGLAYFGSSLGSIYQINLTSFTYMQDLDLGVEITSSNIDTINNIGYFGTTPGQLFKIFLSNFTNAGYITLSNGDAISSIIIDQTTNLAYVGTSSDSELGYVSRINLTSFYETGSILLDNGEMFLSAAEIDVNLQTAYFACSTDPGIVVKMQLTDPEQCQHSNCSSCTSGCSCGWCANTQTCMSGDSRGPFGDSCSAWDYYDCPCSNLTTCGECSLDPRCGWCELTNKCERGNVTQSYVSTCSQWKYGTCVDCNQTTCGACTADDRCGWCSETQSCSRGNSTSPFIGTCQSWNHEECPCSNASTCSQCGTDARCGWCAETQSCRQGNSSIPHSGSCQVWEFPVTCTCQTHTTCDTCSSDSKCGWCATSNTCVEGNATAPYGQTCQNWDYGTCPCSTLERNSNCTSCNSDARCGWCASSNTCMRGNSSAPFSLTCPAWDYGTCPCASSNNCTTCNSHSECGWCESSSSCVRGNSSAPLVGSCSNYDYSTCPLPPQMNCSQYSSCDSCTPFSACVWCESDKTCKNGNQTGPTDGSCLMWNFATCPNCTQYSNCSSCSLQSECGWCETSQQCTRGNSTQSTAASCPDWHFSSCPARNCSIYNSSCSGCTADPECGWCESSLQCIHSASNSSCSAFYASSCPINCSSISNCSGCTNRGECGWCESSQQCASGNSTGNYQGALCPDWSFSTCPLPPQSNCTNYNNSCASCTQFSECGWCDSSKSCAPGNVTGDTTNSCSNGWHYSTCPVQCSDYLNCSDCSSRAECGWCEGTQTCSAGNLTGPSNGSCSLWKYSNCQIVPVDNCTSYNSCATCVPHSECGWCASNSSCFSSSLNSTCSDFRYSTCVSPQFPSLFCSNFTILSSCISARADGVACGWCESNVGTKCFPGNITQPSNATCGNSTSGGGDGGWYFEGTCDFRNCSSCTSNPSCGWCESTQLCVPGNSSSSIQYSCPSYFYASCVNCSRFSNCSQCHSHSSCVWCNTTSNSGSCVSNSTCSSNNTLTCEIVVIPPASLKNHKGLSAGAITGIVAGVIIFLILCALLAYFIYSRRRSSNAKKKPFKPVKVTKKTEELALDEIVPNTTSMIVTASPNLITPMGRSSLSLSSGSPASKYLAGPGSAGEYPIPSSPTISHAHSPSAPSPSLTPLLAHAHSPGTHSPSHSPHVPHHHHSPHVPSRARRDSSNVLKAKARKSSQPRMMEEPPAEPPKKPPLPVISPKIKHISTGPIPKTPPADPANKYAQLDRLLQLPPLEVAAALLEVTNPANSLPDSDNIPDQQSFDASVQALVIVLANDPQKMALLLEWALAKDVHNAESTSVLFGDASTSAGLSRVYFPIIGGAHLASGLGSMILDICTHPEIYKDQVPAATHRILETIQISINQTALPEPLFHLLQIIESLVGMKFSLSTIQLPLIATTFLLRHYYIAALLRPRNFGFITANPSVEARQVLNAILDHIDKLWFESSESLPDAVVRAAALATPSSTSLPPLFTNCQVPKIDSNSNLPPERAREAALAELHRLLDEFIDDLSNFMGIPLRLFQQDIQPREGEEPFDVLCAVVSAKNPDPLPLLQQILAPDLACLLALFEQLATKPDESDELALAAVHVFESYGQTHRLLTSQITNEAKTTLITSNIFKPPTSIGLRIASYYMKIAGSQYLLPTFKNFLDNLELLKDLSYEIDKQKVPNAEQLNQNKENVLKLASEFLDLIIGSLDNIPYIDRKIYRHIHLIIGKYASHEKSHDALIRLFIDGLIVPSLVDPKGYGLYDEDPKPRVHKGLCNVAKILQSTAYALPFATNSPFTFANPFIQKNTQTLQDFVDSLAQQAKRPVSLPPPVPISEELHRVSVACLHHYLTTYINNADYCYCYMKHSYFHRDEAKTDKSYEKDLRELFFRSPTFYELVLVLNNLGTPPLEKHQ